MARTPHAVVGAVRRQLGEDPTDRRALRAQLIGLALAHPYTAPGGMDLDTILDRAEELADAVIARAFEE